MRLLILASMGGLLVAGCVHPSGLTDAATGIRRRVTPAARGFATGSRRLVHAAGQAADDVALAAKVKGILLTRKGLDAGEINIRAEGGTIYLTGRVQSGKEKQLIGQMAGETVGVAGVVNRLKVTRAD